MPDRGEHMHVTVSIVETLFLQDSFMQAIDQHGSEYGFSYKVLAEAGKDCPYSETGKVPEGTALAKLQRPWDVKLVTFLAEVTPLV